MKMEAQLSKIWRIQQNQFSKRAVHSDKDLLQETRKKNEPNNLRRNTSP